jgi:hypothetical protein
MLYIKKELKNYNKLCYAFKTKKLKIINYFVQDLEIVLDKLFISFHRFESIILSTNVIYVLFTKQSLKQLDYKKLLQVIKHTKNEF